MSCKVILTLMQPTIQATDSNPHKTSQKRQGRKWQLLKIAGSWLLAILIAFALQRFAFQSYQVFGQSMEPTLSEGDYLIISKLGATWADVRGEDYIPKRGDIVVLDSPNSGIRLIKRIIGLPGERVTVTNGRVTIVNDEHEDGFDPYESLGLASRFTAGQLTTEVPDGNVFVIGDNRQAGGSLDSRNELGPVPVHYIIGRLAWRLWPFSQPDHS